jgi:hypothetical protein
MSAKEGAKVTPKALRGGGELTNGTGQVGGHPSQRPNKAQDRCLVRSVQDCPGYALELPANLINYVQAIVILADCHYIIYIGLHPAN